MSKSFQDSISQPFDSTQTDQEVDKNSGVVAGKVSGETVTVIGTQIVHNHPPTSVDSEIHKKSLPPLGKNPYKGLEAFRETDCKYFFGREQLIQELLKRFQNLQEDEEAIRVLPIYGPSGSGKSSLVQAGLIPKLREKVLPKPSVGVLAPHNSPLQSLALVLAKLATNDPSPVAKTREFAGELALTNQAGNYDGLQRITNTLPGIINSQLIIVVDQFEEIYTYCQEAEQRKDRERREQERDAFIENLFHAAANRDKRIAVILTMRSDFLAATQQHPHLNRLFSTQGFLVPSMDNSELYQAISEPARRSGLLLNEAVIDLLIEQARYREGTLPLLQFALTQIWKGKQTGKDPAETLREIGGVGGALASEAQRVYDNLITIPNGQAIAQRVFLGLVQLGEGTKDTRRRVALEILKAHKDDSKQFQRVIKRFTDPGVRLITLSSDISNKTSMAEVTHEALFEHWGLLRDDWLKKKRDDLLLQRRLESSSSYWDQKQRSNGLLWRSPDLDLLAAYTKRSGDDMTTLQWEFFQASQGAKRWRIGTVAGGVFVIFALLTGFLWQQAQARKTVEAIFLGSDAKGMLDALPELEKSADDWKQAVNKGEKSENLSEYYQKHREDLDKAFAYYRNILTTTGRLRRANPKNESQLRLMAERAETSLAALLYKYRISQLKSDLEPGKQNFGKYLEKPVIKFEDQYSKGALRTTYEILFTNSGAGADLNKDGFIADEQEAAQIPCDTLLKIEEEWSNATKGQYTWNSQKKFTDDPNGRTLYESIFDDFNGAFASEHIESCRKKPL
ncbi:MAG: ATP-binding protein [Chlorogloeopsis fritschii C42_A2020_084]|uniref:ATP-binding protein n=1 Tax=Chlorogloeopsis fritschii TaxID=1124 RepID=UPI001A047BF3|nr:ATP-binding protein [Chlorogloeopsis fritschii]MBF2008078.1 ATP-binding protein [Chlorogloeopsis fritschii C42_A2020_084]